MATIDQKRARRKLIRILPREILEQMSGHDRPHILSIVELVNIAVDRWDLVEVHDAVERIFRRADPEGTSL